jgi:acyl carrier protein
MSSTPDLSSPHIDTGADTLAALKKIVNDIVPLPPDRAALADRALLFEDCGLDSTSIIDLVLRIESEFGVAIQEEELDLDVLVDLGTLAAFVDRKRADGAQPL